MIQINCSNNSNRSQQSQNPRMFNSIVVNWILQCSSICSGDSFAAAVRTAQTCVCHSGGGIPGVTKTFISDRNRNKIKHQISHMWPKIYSSSSSNNNNNNNNNNTKPETFTAVTSYCDRTPFTFVPIFQRFRAPRRWRRRVSPKLR